MGDVFVLLFLRFATELPLLPKKKGKKGKSWLVADEVGGAGGD